MDIHTVMTDLVLRPRCAIIAFAVRCVWRVTSLTSSLGDRGQSSIQRAVDAAAASPAGQSIIALDNLAFAAADTITDHIEDAALRQAVRRAAEAAAASAHAAGVDDGSLAGQQAAIAWQSARES